MIDNDFHRIMQQIQLDLQKCREQIQEDIRARLSLPCSIDDYYKFLNREVLLNDDAIDELCEIVVKNFKTLIVE